MVVAGKKVLVFGSGISGIGAVKLLEENGADVVLYDGNEKLTEADVRAKLQEGSKARIIIGAFPEELLNTLDLVILSPGVPTDLPIILKMKEKEIPVIGEVELASDNVRTREWLGEWQKWCDSDILPNPTASLQWRN